MFNVTQQKNQKFSASKSFPVTTHAHSYNMCEVYMRKQGKDHFVYVLGKNGEPRSDVGLSVDIIHRYFNSNGGGAAIHQGSIQLTTDREGKVKLGHLKKVAGVTVRANQLGISHNWFIGNLSGGSANLLTYPSQVDVVEGETLEFPAAVLPKKSRKALSLIKTWSATPGSGSIVLEDLFDKVEVISGGDARDYSTIKLANLQEGTYKLKLKKLSKTIHITVHRGQYWD